MVNREHLPTVTYLILAAVTIDIPIKLSAALKNIMFFLHDSRQKFPLTTQALTPQKYNIHAAHGGEVFKMSQLEGGYDTRSQTSWGTGEDTVRVGKYVLQVA